MWSTAWFMIQGPQGEGRNEETLLLSYSFRLIWKRPYSLYDLQFIISSLVFQLQPSQQGARQLYPTLPCSATLTVPANHEIKPSPHGSLNAPNPNNPSSVNIIKSTNIPSWWNSYLKRRLLHYCFSNSKHYRIKGQLWPMVKAKPLFLAYTDMGLKSSKPDLITVHTTETNKMKMDRILDLG